MRYRLPAGAATITRNHTPARFTGNLLRWIVEIEGQKTYCETRDCARAVVAEYREERAALLRAGLRQQAQAGLWS